MALKLPPTVIGTSDVARLLREVDSLNDFLFGAAARKTGQPMTPPKLSRSLDDTAKINKYNLLQEDDRKKLLEDLKTVNAKAPKLHISFAVDPPPRVVESILVWMRTELHPQVLLQIGLQPNIGAGCVLRTPNREIDMSIRQNLTKNDEVLVRLIDDAAKRVQLTSSQPVAAAQPAPVPQSAAKPSPQPAAPQPVAASAQKGAPSGG